MTAAGMPQAPAEAGVDAPPAPELPNHHVRSNPDWLSVVYNLAVLRVNRAIEHRAHPAGSEHDAAARDLGYAVRDAQLLLEAARKECTPWRNRWGAGRRRVRRFLRGNVEPSALVLLAGIGLELRHRPGAPPFAGERKRRRLTRSRVLSAVRASAVPDPEQLVALVERRERRARRLRWLPWTLASTPFAASVHYNLACFHAQRIVGRDVDSKERIGDIADQGIEELRLFAWEAEPGEAASLLRWAPKDPSLQPLREHRAERFQAIVKPH